MLQVDVLRYELDKCSQDNHELREEMAALSARVDEVIARANQTVDLQGELHAAQAKITLLMDHIERLLSLLRG